MFIDLVDALRCLEPHEESWLVAVSRRAEGRSIIEGTLGCPICRREYPIVAGVAYFGVEATEPTGPAVPPPVDEEEALRLAAFLDLRTPGGIVVLEGGWAWHAPTLREIVPVSCLIVDPTGAATGLVGEGIAVLRTRGAIPLAAASARGVALDPSTADDDRVRAAVRVLATRGRLLAPVGVSRPGEVDELARDDALWVGERRVAPSAPVAIGRGARPAR